MVVMQKQEYYNMYASADYLWWYRSLRELLGYYMRRYVKLSARVLDAGCGTGENMAYLQQAGYSHIQGVDLSAEALQLCKKRGLKHVAPGNIAHLDFSDKSFDAIYSMDVISALDKKDQDRAIQEWYRVLKPGGVLIVQSAALEWLRSEHDVVVNVQHRHSKKEFREAFRKFEILKLSYRFFLLFPLIGLVKALKKLTPEHKATSDVDRPPVIVNSVLMGIQMIENYLFRIVSFPIGTSVFLVARKPLKP